MVILFLVFWETALFSTVTVRIYIPINIVLLLLLLSCFSRVRLCETPEMAAHQVPPSLGFSRQKHWSGLPFPTPMCQSKVAQSYPTLRNPMDCSLPGSSIHGIFQARVLEWVAIEWLSIWNFRNLTPVLVPSINCANIGKLLNLSWAWFTV